LLPATEPGSERGVDWVSGTAIVEPDGFPLAGPVCEDTAVTVLARCRLGDARQMRISERNDVLEDRRPELYVASASGLALVQRAQAATLRRPVVARRLLPRARETLCMPSLLTRLAADQLAAGATEAEAWIAPTPVMERTRFDSSGRRHACCCIRLTKQKRNRRVSQLSVRREVARIE